MRRVLAAVAASVVLAGCGGSADITVSPLTPGERPAALDPSESPFGPTPDSSVASPEEAPAIGDGPAGPTLQDHWHVAYGFYVCGAFLPPIMSDNDPQGIHTHGDGVIHIHPTDPAVTGDGATLGVFLRAMGITLLDDDMSMPAEMVAGVTGTCQGDETTQIAIWDSTEDTEPEVYRQSEVDLASIPFRGDRAVITIMLARSGERIPTPPSVPVLDQLTDVSAPPAVLTRPPDGLTAEGPVECPAEDGSSPRITAFVGPPPVCLTDGVVYQAVVETTVGSFTIELDPTGSPTAVNNFVVLARYHFYDGTVFHGIIPGFVAVGGDATGEPLGTGDPGYTLAEEPGEAPFGVGAVGMDSSGPNTTGSRFFVVLGDASEVPNQFSWLGQVVEGTETLTAIGQAGSASGDPIAEVRITSVTIQVAD